MQPRAEQVDQALMNASSAVTTAAPVANRRLRLPALVAVAGVTGMGDGTGSTAGLCTGRRAHRG